MSRTLLDGGAAISLWLVSNSGDHRGGFGLGKRNYRVMFDLISCLVFPCRIASFYRRRRLRSGKSRAFRMALVDRRALWWSAADESGSESGFAGWARYGWCASESGSHHAASVRVGEVGDCRLDVPRSPLFSCHFHWKQLSLYPHVSYSPLWHTTVYLYRPVRLFQTAQ